MNMKEFYEKYNLNKYYFGEMAHVGAKTLLKYQQGKDIREDSKARIEKAIRLVEKYNLVRPKYQNYVGNVYYNMRFTQETKEYMKNFEKLLNEES